MDVSLFSLRSIALENNLKGIKFSYEFFLLKNESIVIFEYLKLKGNKYLNRNFIDTVLTEDEFLDIIKLIKKEEIFNNLALKNYTKIFIGADPKYYFTNEFLPLREGLNGVYAIKAYSRKNGQYLYSLTLDYSLQQYILLNLKDINMFPENGMIIGNDLSGLFKHSYYYMRFNFKKYIYKLENIDPYHYLVDDNNYFNSLI